MVIRVIGIMTGIFAYTKDRNEKGWPPYITDWILRRFANFPRVITRLTDNRILSFWRRKNDKQLLISITDLRRWDIIVSTFFPADQTNEMQLQPFHHMALSETSVFASSIYDQLDHTRGILSAWIRKRIGSFDSIVLFRRWQICPYFLPLSL